MFEIPTLIALIPALPLAAALVTAALGKRVLKGHSHWPVVVALIGSFALSALLVYRVQSAAAAGAAESADGAGAVNGQPSAISGQLITRDVLVKGADDESQVSVGFEQIHSLWTWADIRGAYRPETPLPQAPAADGYDFNIEVALRADSLTAIMLAMVTFVSSLVAIYASGYMRGDPGYWRFFTYIGLFVFSMAMLVSVSNFALLYVFWEAVGACSYLLIGFWFEKPEAAAAGKKAFLVNRVGDFGFALGVFLIWTTYGTLDFHDSGEIAGVLGQSRIAAGDFVTGGVGMAICLLLFVGACGKSAQFPLHVWLPDAMEGPTPVSALIHAATMVTAGVYLVARCAPLFVSTALGFEAGEMSELWWANPAVVVAAIGCFTALLAGLIALTQTDLKRVLAYSTVSQLGFMFLGLGCATLAGITSGMFHLFTHAFFKALLFLAAGSVMHAMGGVIDMRRFGGLRRIMPVTHGTFLVGCLALSGVVPFSGFFSKDAILAAVYEQSRASDWYGGVYFTLFLTALGVAFLTAFYTFRAFFLTFYGEERVPSEAGHHAHESPPSMTSPLVILAVCAAVVGGYFHYTHDFANFLALTPSLQYGPLTAAASEAAAHDAHEGLSHLALAAISTLAALSGVGLAAYLYLGDRWEVAALARRLRPLHALSYGKFFLDQTYYASIVWPLKKLAEASYWIDRQLIDGLVDALGRLPPRLGGMLRSLQIGLVQFYALAMVLGMLVLIGALLRWQS